MRSGLRQLCSLALLLCLLYGLWALFTAGNARSLIIKHYDVSFAGYITVQTEACDIVLIPTSEPTVTYRALYKLAGYEWNSASGDSETISGARFSNFHGCAGMPSGECATLCQVTVGVPPVASGTRFLVRQTSVDKSIPKLTVMSGVAIGELRVEARNMDLLITNATAGTVYASVKDGQSRVQGSTIGTLSLLSTGAGSVHVLDVPAAGRDTTILYRQPSSHVCMASDTRASRFTAAPPSSGPGCDLTSIMAGVDSTNQRFALSVTHAHADADACRCRCMHMHMHMHIHAHAFAHLLCRWPLNGMGTPHCLSARRPGTISSCGTSPPHSAHRATF